MLSEFVKSRSGTIKRVALAHGARKVSVFGSHTAGKSRPRDLDILVRFAPGRDLFDLIGIKLALEKKLRCPVDVVSEGGLSPYLKERILREAIAL